MTIDAASTEVLQRAYRAAMEREQAGAVPVNAMFSTGHDAANAPLSWPSRPRHPIALAFPCAAPKNDVDKASNGAALHP